MIRPFLTTIIAVAAVYAHADFADDADAFLAKAREQYAIPGVSAGVTINGEIVWTGGAGFRDLENQLPATGEMVHRIASITKSMTATAVMQLVERGGVKLRDPLNRHIPDYPKKAQGKIRIEHLLAHTSGITHYWGNENRPFEHYPTLEDALKKFWDRKLAHEPGTAYRYTTYGYTVLGRAIEIVSGQNYEAYMREHIWDPAGMHHTQLAVFGKRVPNMASLYTRDRDGNVVVDPETDLSIKYPGGGLLSTAEDLLRFAKAFDKGRLVSQQTVDRMLEIPKIKRERTVPYALGWMVWDHPQHGQVIGNDGGQAGTTTNLVIYREQRVAVSVIANMYNAEGVVRIREGLAELALNQR